MARIWPRDRKSWTCSGARGAMPSDCSRLASQLTEFRPRLRLPALASWPLAMKYELPYATSRQPFSLSFSDSAATPSDTGPCVSVASFLISLRAAMAARSRSPHPPAEVTRSWVDVAPSAVAVVTERATGSTTAIPLRPSTTGWLRKSLANTVDRSTNGSALLGSMTRSSPYCTPYALTRSSSPVGRAWAPSTGSSMNSTRPPLSRYALTAVRSRSENGARGPAITSRSQSAGTSPLSRVAVCASRLSRLSPSLNCERPSGAAPSSSCSPWPVEK